MEKKTKHFVEKPSRYLMLVWSQNIVLRQEGVSGLWGWHSTRCLGLDADRISTHLTRESFQQLRYGLHITLSWRIITV